MGITLYRICCPNILNEQENGLNDPLNTQLQPINTQRIGFDDFRIQGKIGQGGFGTVFLGELKKNIERGIVQKFAIKMVKKRKIKQRGLVQNAYDQKYIAMYNHDFIVSLAMCFQDNYSIYFVLQYASGGDTYSLIKRSSPKFQPYQRKGQKAVRFIASSVILALQFLHRNGYMYRDLKPQNVLIFQDGYVKLSDFGLAKKSNQDQRSNTFTGTPLYYSPEMVLGRGYDKMVDLWAFGVYLYEMSNYTPPFSQKQVNSSPLLFEQLCLQAQKNRNWTNPQTSPQLKNLINRLLICDPTKRLGSNGWEQVKSHPFFNNFNWKQLEQLKMQSPLKSVLASVQRRRIEQIPEQQLPRIQRDRSPLSEWTYIHPRYI